MRHSIRFRITLILTCCIASTIFLCWFLNRSFLESYYQVSKMEALNSGYTQIAKLLAGIEPGTALTEAQVLGIDRISATENLSAYVIMWEESVPSRPVPVFAYPLVDLSEYKSIKREVDRIFNSFRVYYLSDYTLDAELENIEKVKSTERYDIYRQYNRVQGLNYMDLCGTIENGNIVLLRVNLESLRVNVMISDQFMGYVMLLAVTLGVLLMLFVSRSFTKPIQELSEIAKQMSDLRFDVKYSVKRKDEIGELGSSINLLSEKLEHTISELKGANNELELDLKNKVQIDEMRKDFLSNVTHELKTPIALIQGYAEGLQENVNDDAENRDFYCDVIIDEAKKMNHMVQKLLTLNQLEFGANQLEFECFDMTAIIKSVRQSSELLLKQAEVKVCFDDTQPSYVWADEYMIEEVITNYFSNALHHVKEVNGVRQITIRQERRGERLRVSIANTGDPIPEEELDNIWIKFYKVDKARTREYGGSGIGLSIVRAIMESHNQAYGVENKEDGVEFWFEVDCTAS